MKGLRWFGVCAWMVLGLLVGPGASWGADSTIHALTGDTGPVATDQMYKVDSTGAVDRKVALSNLMKAFTTATVGDGTGPIVWTFGVTGTDPVLTVTDNQMSIAAVNFLTTGSIGATGLESLRDGLPTWRLRTTPR